MRRLFGVLLLIVLAALTALPAAAQDGSVIITWPPPVYDVAGTVSVEGTVNPPGLRSYFLEVADYEADPATALWIPVSLPSRSPVIDGVVAQWITTMVPDGVYRLRLRAQLTNGQTINYDVGPIRIANTLERLDDSSGGAQVVVTTPEPEVIATPEIIPRPVVINELPIEVGGHISGFNESALDYMRSAGMTWIKWQIPYYVGDRSLLDVARERINWSHQNGFYALLGIVGEPDELLEMGDDYYAEFAAFLGEVAAFGPDGIEVWNEQNIDREWPVGRINGAAYVEMLRQAYQAIKAVDPQIKVITGAPAPTGFFGGGCAPNGCDDSAYIRQMANAGAEQYADCIGLHYNEGILPPSARGGDPRGNSGHYSRYFPAMVDLYAGVFPNTPLCFTELGYLTPEGYSGTLPEGFAWGANTSLDEQAVWLADSIDLSATGRTRVDLLIVWNVDFSSIPGDPQGAYAIIREDGSCLACEYIGSLRGQG